MGPLNCADAPSDAEPDCVIAAGELAHFSPHPFLMVYTLPMSMKGEHCAVGYHILYASHIHLNSTPPLLEAGNPSIELI